MESLKLSIIIPAQNEERGIHFVLEKLVSHVSGPHPLFPHEIEIIVVNDGSTDQTASVVGKMCGDFPCIKLINHRNNQGYGTALKTGFREARGEYIGFLDADGSYPPEAIFYLFSRIVENGADIVWGSRLMNGKKEMPFIRWLGNLFFRILTNILFRSNLTDVTSGMRVFKKELAPHFFSLPYGLEFSPAMSAIALQKGLTVEELPIPYEKRIGKSKLKIFEDGFKFLFAIMACKYFR